MPRIIVLVFSLILSAPSKSISFFPKYVNDFNTGTIIFLKTDTLMYTRFGYNTSEVFKVWKIIVKRDQNKKCLILAFFKSPGQLPNKKTLIKLSEL